MDISADICTNICLLFNELGGIRIIEVEVIKEFEDKINKNKTRVVGETFTTTIERVNQLMYDNENQISFVKIISIKQNVKNTKGSE